MKIIYPGNYPEGLEYHPIEKGCFFKIIEFLATCFIIFLCFSLLIVIGYVKGVDYTLSLWPAPIEINHVEPPVQPRAPEVITGVASWYDYDLNGVVWSKNHRTAASRRFARYSYVKVTNQDNGKSVVVFINDHGPTKETGREIDLSSHAFSQLAPLSIGLINVKIEQL